LWAFWEIVGLSTLGWVIYRRGYLAGNIVPVDKQAYASFRSDGRPPDHHTAFAPLVFSIENSLPLVKLGQGDKWRPEPSPKVAPFQQKSWPTALGPPRPRTKLSWSRCFLVYCGLEPDPNTEKLRSQPSRWLTSSKFLRWFLWFQILLGWLLATLFLAGVTGLVRNG
jgi:hypothetical protein